MKNNELMPLETSTVPYMRPYTHEKKKMPISVMLISIIFVLATAIICAALFMPQAWKDRLSAFLQHESTADQTSTEATDSTENSTSSTSETTNIYEWNPEIPQGATPIKPCDLSANTQGMFAENPTDAVLEMVNPKFPKASSSVSVIIVNTHSFESYADAEMPYFTDAAFASNGEEENRIAAVCQSLSASLNAQGIHTVFIDCQAVSSFGSYQNARSILAQALEDYPEAVLAIDLHRAIFSDEKGAVMRPITVISDEITAQVRILLGTGAGFEENTAAALAFYETANLTYPTLMMPLSVSEGSFLQNAEIPVLTLEIGSVGNSVEEANHAAVRIAEILAEKLK